MSTSENLPATEDSMLQDGIDIYISKLVATYKTVDREEDGVIKKTPAELIAKWDPVNPPTAEDINNFILKMKLQGLNPTVEDSKTDFDFIYLLKVL